MTDLIAFANGKTIDLKKLPKELQKRINEFAVIDILKDQAKEKIKAKQIKISKFVNQSGLCIEK